MRKILNLGFHNIDPDEDDLERDLNQIAEWFKQATKYDPIFSTKDAFDHMVKAEHPVEGCLWCEAHLRWAYFVDPLTRLERMAVAFRKLVDNPTDQEARQIARELLDEWEEKGKADDL